MAKINVALEKMDIPDPPAALSELDGAKDEVEAAGLTGAEQASLISGINQIQANINSGGNGHSGGGSDMCAYGITHTRDGGQSVPSSSQCENIFFFNYEKFYDSRELRYLDVVDIDVNQLGSWASTSSRRTEVLYITVVDTVGAEDAKGDGIFPVIRLLNASTLPNPITFATNHPLYLQGDYNTGVWQPSALAADALTYLSTVWDDAEHQAATVIRPWAANTTVYAAVMAGSSGTPCDHEAAGCGITSPYGGGLENFPRFLERWSGRSLTFRGSLVSLFFSTQGNGPWGCCNYYAPPIRDWKFDLRFNDPANMPPGTPVVGNVIHTAFRPIF